MPRLVVTQGNSSQELKLEKTQLAETKTKPSSMKALATDSAVTQAMQAGVSTASTNIAAALTQIKTTYPTATPRVVVTGYYRLFPASPAASCVEMSGIDQSELAWINQLQDDVNAALQTTTTGFSFASYVPISFAGHELCTTDSWLQGLGDTAPYHPTAAGQQAIADQILASLKAAKK